MPITPPAPILIFRQRHATLQSAVAKLQRGESPVDFEGQSYTELSLPELYRLLEHLGVKAAIEGIESGSQSYSINGTTFTRADLRALYERDARFESRSERTTRGGIRTRFGVPSR